MNKLIKNRWIEALRSGQFPQGYEALQANGKFCCLGVVCELVKGEIALIVHPDLLADGVVQYGNFYETGMLPFEVEDYVNLGKTRQEQLINMNDEERIGFDEIADWIEKNL